MRAEINEIEMKKTIKEINETKNFFISVRLKTDSKIDKPLSRLIKKKRERTHINKIRNENISYK